MKTAFYVRVSTSDQTVDNQLRELNAVAAHRGWTVVKTFTDAAVSGAKTREQRPGLQALMDAAHKGEFDLVAAWSVDRLGRSLKDLLRTSDDLRALNVALYLHQQNIDTTTPTGKLTYSILGAISEWERVMIRERVNAGIRRAVSKGIKFGPRVKLTPETEAKVLALSAAEPKLSVREIARQAGTSKTQVGRIVKAAKAKALAWLE